MARYNVGDRVIRVSSGQKGVVLGIGPCGRGGRQLYHLFMGGAETDELEASLMPDYDITDPFERCRQQVYGPFSEFCLSCTTIKIGNRSVNTVSSLKASKTLFRAYQFKPLLKFLNSDNKRILVADEVGLGKTIEAGHIMLEMKARGELRNALVVCPLSLQQKWREELRGKFGLTFTIVGKWTELVSMLQDRDGSVRAIVNYDKLRSQTNEAGEERNELLAYMAQAGKGFSLVLCDEAHRLRNEGTQTYRGMAQVMQSAGAAVFLTATPIMISERNLYNLLHLLDDQRYSNYAIFEQGMRENAPFVRALMQLSTRRPLPQIADELAATDILYKLEIGDRTYTHKSPASEYFEDFPIFRRIMERMRGQQDSPALRAQLQYDLMAMSQMNQVFSRTRKRDITTDWTQAERHPHTIRVQLHQQEQSEHDRVIEEYVDDNSYTTEWGEQVMTQGGALGLVQKKRQVASSVYAYLNRREDLEQGIDLYAHQPDAKVDKLLEIIGRSDGKVIVFALFTNTILYLCARLRAAGYGCLAIHGGTSDRQAVIEEFRASPQVSVLLSSEVGSEGLDMQFCHTMVNYDLPWNPMVVEQRIGRIDRFGQESPVVNIFNLVVQGSIQEDICERLLDRIGIFKQCIGDLEAIFDAEVDVDGTGRVRIGRLYASLEKEMFCTQLSQQERQRKIDEIAQAVMNERESLRQIEEGLTDALTNDAYFQDEINRILNNNAYVTAPELANYVAMLLRDHLTTCELDDHADGTYTLRMPLSNSSALRTFLAAHEPDDDEGREVFRRFANQIREERELRLTFDQDVAYRTPGLLHVNIYNPIIQAAQRYFHAKADERAKTFAFAAPAAMMPGVPQGLYMLATYAIDTSKTAFGQRKTHSEVYAVVYDVQRAQLWTDEAQAAAFIGKVQRYGHHHTFAPADYPDDTAVTEAQLSIVQQKGNHIDWLLQETRLQTENSMQMLRKQTEDYYTHRIRSMQNALDEAEWRLRMAQIHDDAKAARGAEGALRLLGDRLSALRREQEDRLAIITQDPDISITDSIVSLNLVKVT